MPQTRKRKAVTQEPADDSNVVGDTEGDYRVTGQENSTGFESFTVLGDKGKDIPCQARGSGKGIRLVFTHGAGGGLENPATKLFAEGYATKGPVVCFKGTMNLQSRVKSFQSVIAHLQSEAPDQKLAVGGRSMGARAAVMTAQQHEEIKKLVLVSYPLTSPKGEMRDQILLDLPADKQILFITGSNDNMCDLGELQKVRDKMKAKSILVTVEGADHGMSLVLGLRGKEKEHAIEELRRFSGQQAVGWAENPNNLADKSHVVWDSAKGDVIHDKNHVDASGKEIDQNDRHEEQNNENIDDERENVAVSKPNIEGSNEVKKSNHRNKRKKKA